MDYQLCAPNADVGRRSQIRRKQPFTHADRERSLLVVSGLAAFGGYGAEAYFSAVPLSKATHKDGNSLDMRSKASQAVVTVVVVDF